MIVADDVDWVSRSMEIEIVDAPDSPYLRCEGKSRYGTEDKLRAVIARRSAAVGFQLYGYRCGRCGLFHISKHPPSVYLSRIQDSAMCATSATAATNAQPMSVSAGQTSMQAAMAAAGITSSFTSADPRRSERAAREGRS